MVTPGQSSLTAEQLAALHELGQEVSVRLQHIGVPALLTIFDVGKDGSLGIYEYGSRVSADASPLLLRAAADLIEERIAAGDGGTNMTSH